MSPTTSPSASAATAPAAYQFGTLETQQSTAAQEAAQGVKIAELTIGWDNYEPADGSFNATYASQMKTALQTFQAAGMKVVLGLGMHYPPSWVFNYADSKYVDQYGGTSGQVNLVFNNVLRQKVQAMLANINAAIGLNNFYAVRITSGGDAEVLFPSENSDSAHGNEYWAYDKNAVGADANRPSTIPVNPMIGWTPGQTSWNGSTVTTTQVTNWYNWYLGALDDVVNWQIGMYRNLGYTGQYQILTPGSGTRPSNYASGVSNYLNGSGDGDQTMGRGAAWDRIYSGISNKANVVAYVSSMADGSGNNDLCTASDASVSPTSSTINGWSATRWIAYIANNLGLQKAGENPGAGTSGYGTSMMTATSQQMQTCGFQGILWAHDNDLFAGTSGVSLAGYASTIAAANAAAATATAPATATPVPPSATATSAPPSATSVPPSATATRIPATATSVPPTSTPTATTAPPTAVATSTSTPDPTIVLKISGPLTLSASTVTAGQTLAGVTTLTNTGSSAVTLNNIVIAGRPPNGTNSGGPFMDFGATNAVTLNAGQSLTVQKSRAFTSSDPTGAWYSYVTYQTTDGVWHDNPANVSFSVTAPATSTPVAAGATNTPIPPNATGTTVRPSATATSVPATATATATNTATATDVPPSATATSVPATSTPLPPTATATDVPATATATSTATATDAPPSATATSVPATSTATATNAATATDVQPSATSTNVAATVTTPAYTATPTATAPTSHGTRHRARSGSGVPTAMPAPTGAVSAVNGFSTLPLDSTVNNAGTSSDGSAHSASLDGLGWSLSAQALRAAGVQPGTTLAAGGATFTWPSGTSGVPNNVRADGQTITPAATQSATALTVLGVGTSGPAGGAGTVFYADGTAQPFTLTFSDWTLNGGRTAAPIAGNTVAVRMPYRDAANGSRDNVATYIFTTNIPLHPGHAVQRIVLPRGTNGQLHIFGVALTSTSR